MKFIRLSLFMLLLIKSPIVFSQVKVNVLCNGKFIEREYKTYDECNCNSWAIQYYENGNNGGQEWGKSRSRIIEVADHWCLSWAKWDGKAYSHSEPYCNDNSFCEAVPKTIEEFRIKLRALYNSEHKSLAEWAAKMLGYTGPVSPSVGRIINEYKSQVDAAVEKNRKLGEFNSDFANKTMDEMVAELNNSQNEYNSFQAASNTFNNAMHSSQANNSWQKLPDGTFYQIQPNGMYEFFDGIDQMETVSEAEGRQELSRHQAVHSNKTTRENNAGGDNDGDLSSLRALYNQLQQQLNDLRQSGDGDVTLIKESEKLLRDLKQQIDALEK